MKQPIQADKFAKDAWTWRESARHTHRAAMLLFQTEDLYLCFPAATLGHHALEKYLKTALICSGGTVAGPQIHQQLIPAGGLNTDDVIWGHNVVRLGSLM